MKTGIELIAEERQEQIKKHDRSLEYDKNFNKNGQLRRGAMALLSLDDSLFSNNWEVPLCQKMMQKSYKDRLIIAGAFIAAELDRIS